MQIHNNTLLHLSLINDVGPAAIFKLLKFVYLQKFPDTRHGGWHEIIETAEQLDFSLLYRCSSSDFVKGCGIEERLASTIQKALADGSLVSRQLEKAYKIGARAVTIFDDEYPDMLRHIAHPPIVLFCQGSVLGNYDKRISIVGSRKASTYAQVVIKHFIPELVQNGWQIVSGGAKGVDGMAHEAVLGSGGTTIVVIGSGLANPYPHEHKKLFETVAANGGTVISPFHMDAFPDRGNFPARNRIIAGLTLGCVVVQAAAKSGALITARFALEQGRSVFAVPGPIYDELSAGCHALIKDGAKLVGTVSDILEEFGQSNAAHMQSVFNYESVNAPVVQNLVAIQQTEQQTGLLGLLKRPATFDELLSQSGLDEVELQDKLFQLQLDGVVRQNFAGLWEGISTPSGM